MASQLRVEEGRGRGAGSRAAQVYQALVERLRRGDLAPGMRLREDDLAQMLGVSRTPVRDALGRLQSRGLVEAVQGGLAIVALSRQRILEIYALRAILEGAAARFAAQNASEADLAVLVITAERFAKHLGDAASFARLNADFHAAIYAAAHNSYLLRMLDDLNDSLALLPKTTFAVPGRAQAAIGEHQLVLAAIEARNAGAAEAAARAHIDLAMKARLELVI